MASVSTPSAIEPAKDLILVHTVQLKPMVKAHFSGRLVSSGINDVAFASLYSEKTHLKKLMMKIIYYYEKISRISSFCWAAEMDFQRLARPKNVSVTLKI